MPPTDIDHAMRDPASAYSGPEALATDERLTTEQKIEALRQWEYDVREAEVAEEEGMADGGGDVLRQILIALAELGDSPDGERSAPSKQRPYSD